MVTSVGHGLGMMEVVVTGRNYVFRPQPAPAVVMAVVVMETIFWSALADPEMLACRLKVSLCRQMHQPTDPSEFPAS